MSVNPMRPDAVDLVGRYAQEGFKRAKKPATELLAT